MTTEVKLGRLIAVTIGPIDRLPDWPDLTPSESEKSDKSDKQISLFYHFGGMESDKFL